MSGNGMPPEDTGSKSLGEIVAEVSEKASQLVREEIELAKAEVTDKLSKLSRGAVIAGAAGVLVATLGIAAWQARTAALAFPVNGTAGFVERGSVVPVAAHADRSRPKPSSASIASSNRARRTAA